MLDHASPMPPIVPNWKYLRLKVAAGWDTLFVERMEKFKLLIPNFGSAEIVNLEKTYYMDIFEIFYFNYLYHDVLILQIMIL